MGFKIEYTIERQKNENVWKKKVERNVEVWDTLAWLGCELRPSAPRCSVIPGLRMSGDAGAAAVAERRVLSVQSHVIHRYVGNTRAPGPAPEKGGGATPPVQSPLANN